MGKEKFSIYGFIPKTIGEDRSGLGEAWILGIRHPCLQPSNLGTKNTNPWAIACCLSRDINRRLNWKQEHPGIELDL